MATTLFDARGCLTVEGLAALGAAPPGRGPAEAAAHLAACARCQRRLLAASGETGISAVPRKVDRPPMWRTFAVLAAGLLAVASALFGIRWLASQ